MKNKTLLKGLAGKIKKTAHEAAGFICINDWYQPKVPQVLKRQNEKN